MERSTCTSYGPDPLPILSPLEAHAAEAARSRLGGGSAQPQLSGTLTAAARILARRATAGAAEPLARTAVRDALALACAYDPSPAAFSIRASPSQLQEAVRQAVAGAQASHFGAGVVEVGGAAVAVILATGRTARLDPFPLEVKQGSSAALSGELRGGLRAPRVFVTLPSGNVQELDAAGARAFRSTIAFPARGRYVVEVVAEGAGGPTVSVLLAVAAGGVPVTASAGGQAEDPTDPAQAEAGVVAAIAALRARHGLPPVTSSPELAEVARRHSAAMRATGKIAHVLPGSGGPGERLTRARVGFLRVLENVAAARTALTAHEAAADSPAHRKNLLEPKVSLVGVGIAREILPSGDPRVYLTELLVQPVEGSSDGALAPDARVREALWRERARLGLPPLTADVTLDAIAREGAGELRSRDAQELPDLATRALALRRNVAAADGFVASAPSDAIRSGNLRDARFRRVGVGVVEGSSRRFGAGRLFIAVVYTD